MQKTLLFALCTLPLFSDPTFAVKKEASAHKLQKVLFVALARDAARAAEVEEAVKQEFTQKGIPSDSLRVVAGKTSASVKELTDLIRAQGYDSLLCMGPRKTIRITPQDKAGGFASMENCLTIFLTGTYPSGEPLEVDPVVAEPIAAQPEGETGSSLKAPIPTNPAAASVGVYKGTLRFFDVASEGVLWEGSIHLRMPRDLRTGFQTKLFSREVIKAVQKSGLLP